MEAEPCGPEVVVGQLQFEFDGIPSLTLGQRISNWLYHQDRETVEVYTAQLFLADNESRRRRADRWNEVRGIQRSYDHDPVWMAFGGVEMVWLYNEACQDYVDGTYFSALLCAHAACERELAGRLVPYREDLPKGWVWWGLGKLILNMEQRNLIDSKMCDDLRKLNEIRKVSAHFKLPNETATAVEWRANIRLTSHPDLRYEDAVNSIMQADTLFAIRVATTLVRSNLGFLGSRP